MKEGLNSPVRTGNCKQCGQCCQNFGWLIVYASEDTLEWMRARDPEIKIQPYEGIEDYYWVSIPYSCKQLEHVGDGKYHCKLHDSKPELCKQYPEHLDELKPGCGFEFDAN